MFFFNHFKENKSEMDDQADKGEEEEEVEEIQLVLSKVEHKLDFSFLFCFPKKKRKFHPDLVFVF